MTLARLRLISILAAALWLISHSTSASVRSAGAQVADSLLDGTVVRHFRLANGLRVVTRDVPGSGAVAITVAYGSGTDRDSDGREGLSSVLAYAAFHAAAGDIPERTAEDLDSARPLGWNVEVTRRVTRLTEIASLPQFAGVLHQVAIRMRGTTISPKVLAATQADVRGRLARNYRDVPGSALYYQVRELGGPGGYARAERYASGRGIEKVTVDELRRSMAERFVPANAVLSLAGDLSATKLDLGRVLESEFGTIPAGNAVLDAPSARPDSARHWVERSDLPEPIGVIGVITPALSDTLHPNLFLHSILMGSAFSARWPRTKTLPSRFQYSITDDPDLIRIYPIVTSSDYEIGIMRESYLEAMLAMTRLQIRPEEFYALQGSVRWLLGGPLNKDLRQRVDTDRGLLMTLATSAATRELWGGETFWRDYRRRYDAIERPNLSLWADYFTAPANMIQLMYRMAEPNAGK